MVKINLPDKLKKQWHPTKNDPINVSSIPNSRYKAWWLDTCGHEWQARIEHRQNGSNCPYCSGNKILMGFNDFATFYPKLAKQWHPTKNGVLSPTEIGKSSTKIVWWLHPECNHEWEQNVVSRLKSETCSVCAGKKILIGFNDFGTTDSEIASEWHPTKNEGITPQMFSRGSNKKVWWLGKDCGHEWEAKIQSRTGKDKTGCLVCSSRTLQVGVNDFLTMNPKLASEWHPTKNNDLQPEHITSGVKNKIWWEGTCGHSWSTAIYNRTGPYTKGCPYCVNKISKAEKELADYLEKYTQVVRNSKTILNNSYELDMYLPNKNIAVEFNGLYWHDESHKSKEYHYNKWLACKEKNIQLIQIWEDDWLDRKDIVKKMLLHKLGIQQNKKIGARKTKIKELSSHTIEKFLNKTHIQGSTSGSVRYGLFTNENILIAAILFKIEPNTEGKVLNLLRFATSETVVGGFTKLLNHVQKTYNPNKIVTFSDNCVSDGGLYLTTGFTLVNNLAPDYMYVVNRRREHKFNYRLKRFKNDESLHYIEGYTEKDLAQLNNLPRIWDAGKIKWVKNY